MLKTAKATWLRLKENSGYIRRLYSVIQFIKAAKYPAGTSFTLYYQTRGYLVHTNAPIQANVIGMLPLIFPDQWLYKVRFKDHIANVSVAMSYRLNNDTQDEIVRFFGMQRVCLLPLEDAQSIIQMQYLVPKTVKLKISDEQVVIRSIKRLLNKKYTKLWRLVIWLNIKHRPQDRVSKAKQWPQS